MELHGVSLKGTVIDLYREIKIVTIFNGEYIFLLKLNEIALYDMKINYIINITVLLSLQLKMFFNIS